jgi:putative transcriptional regulator
MDVRGFSGPSRQLGALFAACAAAAFVLAAAGKARGAEWKPYFLVATSNLGDPIFERSVILMLPPPAPPNPIIAGLIINKPTAIPLHRLFPKAFAVKDQTAYFGGPVRLNEASLLIRGSAPPGKATHIVDDIYMSTDPTSINSTIGAARSLKNLRLLLGRAQWTREQLHHEIMEGAWYVTPPNSDMVFSSNPGRIWHTLVQRGQLLKVEAAAPDDLQVFDLLPAPGRSPY